MDTLVERAANQLAWELETRKSIELKVRTEILSHDRDLGPQQDYNIIVDHYIETALGQRKCDSFRLKDGKVVGRSTHFSDGSRCAEVVYKSGHPDKQTWVFIKRTYSLEDRSDKMNRPMPIDFLHVCREPLHKALPKAEPLGTARVLGRDCDVFLFRQLRWSMPQDHVYYLDRATSIPLKVESFQDQGARANQQPMWVWTAESLDSVQGYSLPLASESVQLKPSVTWKFRAELVEFNKDYPASTFWPVLQPGVIVHDYIANRQYRVPGAVKAMPDLRERTSTVQPVQAIPPQGLGAAVSNFALGCGLVVLAVGLVLWLRRRLAL